MENNKRRGAGGITFLMLIVILFGALWFTNQIEQKERELSYSEFRSLVEEGNAVDVTVVQNRDVPTGHVELNKKGDDSGNEWQLNVADVKEICNYLDEQNVEYQLEDVPEENWMVTSLLPSVIMIGGILLLFYMMNRQNGANNKAMNFGRSRAKLHTGGKSVTFENVAGLQEEKEDAEQKMFILAEKVDQYRDDEETLKTALLNAQRMGESVIHEARQKAETIIYDANSKASQLKNEADASVAASQAELERLKKEVAQFKSTVLELYRQHIASLTNVPGEETLKPAQKPEAKQPAAEPPAAQQAEKKQPGKPRAKKEKQADVPPAGQAPMYDYDEDRPDAPAHSGDAMFGNYKGITFED